MIPSSDFSHPIRPEFDLRAGVSSLDDPDQILAWLRSRETEHHCRIVCFNADLMAGIAHARSAMRHAVMAWSRQEAIAHSFGMEALLFASASRQCHEAARFGLHSGENHLYLGVWPGVDSVWIELDRRFRPVPSDTWDEISEERAKVLMEVFHITRKELEVIGEDRLQELVLERVALLVVNR